jgi:hypothetical protein
VLLNRSFFLFHPRPPSIINWRYFF